MWSFVSFFKTRWQDSKKPWENQSRAWLMGLLQPSSDAEPNISDTLTAKGHQGAALQPGVTPKAGQGQALLPQPQPPLCHIPLLPWRWEHPPPTTASIEKGKRGLLSYIPRLKPPFLAPIPDWGLPQRAQSCPTLLLPMHSQGKASSWALPHHSRAAHTHLVPRRMRKQLWEP